MSEILLALLCAVTYLTGKYKERARVLRIVENRQRKHAQALTSWPKASKAKERARVRLLEAEETAKEVYG